MSYHELSKAATNIPELQGEKIPGNVTNLLRIFGLGLRSLALYTLLGFRE